MSSKTKDQRRLEYLRGRSRDLGANMPKEERSELEELERAAAQGEVAKFDTKGKIPCGNGRSGGLFHLPGGG